MRALIVAALVALGLAAVPERASAQANQNQANQNAVVMALARHVCLAHGGDLPTVATMARQVGWRPLDLNELEAANEPNFSTYWRAGWAIEASGVQVRL